MGTEQWEDGGADGDTLTVVMPAPQINEGSVDVDTQTGDHDRYKHIVLESQEHVKVDENGGLVEHEEVAIQSVVEGVVMGSPVVALCGKVWVPEYIGGGRFPLCPRCKEIAEEMGGRIVG